MVVAIMRALPIVLALVACDAGKKSGSGSAGSGSAGSGVATLGSAAPVVDAGVACDLAGSYRLRFHSNGADGWWLRFKIADDKAELTAKDVMSLFPQGPLRLSRDGCKATITASNEHSGDTKLVFTLDPATNAITGELSRTKGGDVKNGPETVPIAGRRDVAPLAVPACIKPGVYELAINGAKWKLAEGESRFGTCADMASTAHARVSIELLGDQLFVDEVSGEDNEQSFQRGKLTKINECEYGLALEVTDFSFDGTIKFAADKITGTAKTARYQVFEDGDAGENLWACKTKNAPLAGKRIAD